MTLTLPITETVAYDTTEDSKFDHLVMKWYEPNDPSQEVEAFVHVREIAGLVCRVKSANAECLRIPLYGDNEITILGTNLNRLCERLRKGMGFIIREGGTPAPASGVTIEKIVVKSFEREADALSKESAERE